MTRLTDKRIAEIEARCEASTPGKWQYEAPNLFKTIVPTSDGGMEKQFVFKATCEDGWCATNLNMKQEDADFICSAREDIPDLLAEVKALRGQNEWLEKIRWMHNEDAQFMLDEISRVSKEVKALKAEKAQAEAERDVLAEVACGFAEEYGACDICPANGVTCSESDCIEDLIKYAQQQAEKKGV